MTRTRFPEIVNRVAGARFGRYETLSLVRFRASDGRVLLAARGRRGARVYRDAGRLADPVPVEVETPDMVVAETPRSSSARSASARTATWSTG